MEHPTDPIQYKLPELAPEEMRERLRMNNEYYDHKLALALIDMQSDMELRDEGYDHAKTDKLGKEVLANEAAAIDFDAQDTQSDSPLLSRQRQSLLRRTAVLYMYGRRIIPNYGESIAECIQRYNELERQAPSGRKGEQNLLIDEDIMDDYGKIREKADDYLHQQRWTTKLLGKIGTKLAGHGRKR